MVQFIVIKRFHQGRHLVEYPYLALKRDPVNIIRETNIVHQFLIERESDFFGERRQAVHHVFVPQKRHRGPVVLVHERVVFFERNIPIEQLLHDIRVVLIVVFGVKNRFQVLFRERVRLFRRQIP